ncbi:MAG: Lrp/AsnC family transcriptional regulator [Nitrososphaerales archaeon]
MNKSRKAKKPKIELTYELEELDLLILSALQDDARASYRDIARKLAIAVGTVQSRIKKMQETNLIRGFRVDLDHSKLGLGLTALILLRVGGKHLREVESKLSQLNNVTIVYDVTGDSDVAIVAKFRGTPEMDAFIKEVLSMDYVERSVTSIVLNRVKESNDILLKKLNSTRATNRIL